MILIETWEEEFDNGSWWDDWGRCAGSIVGDALIHGATLFGVGAAAGTVIPVVGTLTAGFTLGIIGFIGGGIKGAVDGC